MHSNVIEHKAAAVWSESRVQLSCDDVPILETRWTHTHGGQLCTVNSAPLGLSFQSFSLPALHISLWWRVRRMCRGVGLK